MTAPDEKPQRPAQTEPFLLGCAWPAGDEAFYPRCDPGPAGLMLPNDTRAAAAIPAGVCFGFCGKPSALVVDYNTRTDDLGYRGAGAGTAFTLFRNNELLASVPAQLGRGSAAFALDEKTEANYLLYLPEGMRPEVLALHTTGGDIRPLPAKKRWLCYGDSIAEGWCASGPAGAWPHVAARQQNLDVVNLGYAGSARGEIQSALDIASLPADVISISHGTNCWTRTPHSAALFAAGLQAFLDLVRQGHPQTPIVAISPILRQDAEHTTNALGASLSDLRQQFETVITQRIQAGDRRLLLVPGLELVPDNHFPDGIHPDDEGHIMMADALGPMIANACNA